MAGLVILITYLYVTGIPLGAEVNLKKKGNVMGIPGFKA